jgi:hypothetical protein
MLFVCYTKLSGVHDCIHQAVQSKLLGGNPCRPLLLCGRVGSTADGLTLFERLEQRLEEHPARHPPFCLLRSA